MGRNDDGPITADQREWGWWGVGGGEGEVGGLRRNNGPIVGC